MKLKIEINFFKPMGIECSCFNIRFNIVSARGIEMEYIYSNLIQK